MHIIKLNTTVLKVSGNAAKFLNGLTSNTLDKAQNAFLNIHGRIIATFDQIKIAEDEFLLVIASQAVEAVLNHIGRYAKLSGTSIEKTGIKSYFDLDGNVPIQAGDWVIVQKAGRMILTSRDLEETVSISVFTLFRVEYQIPVHTLDYQDAMVLNVSINDFVSFTKGCFLGQEPVAKVYNRSKPSWKLSICFKDEISAQEQAKMTSKTQDPATGRVKGFCFIKNI